MDDITTLTHLTSYFAKQGYPIVDIPLLQPAEPFLDSAGEDMRRRIFITSDRAGRNLCLRPEFTIPVCLAHLKSNNGNAAQAHYAYGGSVFRQDDDGVTEFVQAGVEVIGAIQSNVNDVECIQTALDAVNECCAENKNIIFGDQAIFEALLEALELPKAWRAKLSRAFGDDEKLNTDLQMIANGDATKSATIEPQLQEALATRNLQDVTALIAKKMEEASLPSKGGRTASDIAERMLVKAELAASQLSKRQRDILNTFLALEVPVKSGADALREFAENANINLDGSIANFSERCDLLQALVSDKLSITWRAGFGRRLDYYTGIVFEIFEIENDRPICGGGRYDNLMAMLGAQSRIPAVGFSIRLDRIRGNVT